MSDAIDHLELAESRLATQYRESTNLINYIRSLLLEANTLEQVFRDLIELRWINTATGVNLDILGAIVGQPRTFIGAELFGYFGFAVNVESGPFGSVSDAELGDRFRSVYESATGVRNLSDDEYRIWIKARIAKNKTRSTPEDIISQLKLILGVDQVLFIDGDTEYWISIGKILNGDEKSIILNTDIIPKTAGVKVNYTVQYDYERFFSFAGVPNSKGFGSVSNENLGGIFGRLINQ